MVGRGRGPETGLSGLTGPPGFMPQPGTATPAPNPGTLRSSSCDFWGPDPVALDSDDYMHLQPVIDSLPDELNAWEWDEAVQFIGKYSSVFRGVSMTSSACL